MIITNKPSSMGVAPPMININISSNTTVYLEAYLTLGSGNSNSGCGNLAALRIV